MQLPFFVYGTLRPGERNHTLIGWAVSEVRAASVKGLELWDLGRYPMAVEGNGVIAGELLTIHPEYYEEALARLDDLEGVNPAAPTAPGGLYWRTRRQATRPDGSLVDAWIYLGEPRRALRGRHISGGDWKQRSG
jgi:gamma-glutamylcyclotransferase (GGCT)/AIG2-like uncharacterized protein YtfP